MSDDPTPKESRWLRSDRLEASSDGVFAITITLLVLDLAVPSVEEGDVGHHLIEEWPMYVAYLVSFASIGAAWVAHSVITDHVTRGLEPAATEPPVAVLRLLGAVPDEDDR